MITNVVTVLALGLTLWLAVKFPRQAALLLAFILPSYLIRLSVGPIPTTYLELSVWIVTLGIVINRTSRQNLINFITNLHRPFIYAAAGFLLAAAISTIISPNLRSSAGILKGWVITPIVAGAIISSTTRSKKDTQSIIFALIASGTAMAAYALMAFHPGSRLVGVYDVPNSLALFISPLLTASIWQLWTVEEKMKKYLLLFASIVMGIALLGTQSVGGIFSVIAALTIGYILYLPTKTEVYQDSSPAKGRLGGVGTLGGIIIILVGISLAAMWQTGKLQYLIAPLLNHEKTNSISVRLQLWSISMDLIREHPLLGIGLGQFEPNYQRKLHERFIESQENYPLPITHYPLREFLFRDPHNWLLSFYLNTGPLGLISFAFLNIFALKNFFQERNSLRITHYALLITVLLFGLTDTIYWKNDLAIVYWLIIFIILEEAKTDSLIQKQTAG